MTLEPLRAAITAFDAWLGRNGYCSYDPYDIWGTKYGLAARQLYYRKHPLGVPLIAPLLFIETFCPGLRKAFVKPNRFATADAQLLLGFVNLYECTGEEEYLAKAQALGKDLLGYSIPGYSGHCWGYPFDWQNQRGMWARNTPFITCTPYCFDAYLALYDATEDHEYLRVAESIATFVHDDLRDTETRPDAAAASYSPKDNSLVVNASAYRAWVLFCASARFARDRWRKKAERNLNYILESQRADGSWYYATDGHGNFIDHFHTCFVLKNLFKINELLRRPELTEAIRRGFEFYRTNLFIEGAPKSFAIQPRTGLVRLEMYNFAEAITLGALLRDEIPDAFTCAQELANVLCRKYQLREGYFVTRVYIGGIHHKFPFLRWPQSQLFYALTNLFRASVTCAAASAERTGAA